MGILQDLYNSGRSIISGIASGVSSLFKWGASGLYNAFTSITNFVRNAVNWAWQGFNSLYNGIKAGISGIGAILGQVYDWVLTQFRSIFAALMSLLNELFRITEQKIKEYGQWQASLQMELESGILGGCQDP